MASIAPSELRVNLSCKTGGMSTTTGSSAGLSVPSPRLRHALSLLRRPQVGFALRSAVACALVGVATVYSPAGLRRYLTFPAFSYVTAVLITGDAKLADALSGVASALCGTLLGAAPTMIVLLLIPARGFSVAAATLLVALSALVIALPEATTLVAKRIALGQIVIIYVTVSDQYGHFGRPEAFLHPVHIAASTAAGVVASLVASLFPYPRLAGHEMEKKKWLYKETLTERLRLSVDAFFADNKSCKVSLISNIRSLTSASIKLLHSIKLQQANVKWERNPLKWWSTTSVGPSEELQVIEEPMQGMEMAISSMAALPAKLSDQQFKCDMMSLRNLVCLGLIEQNNFMDDGEMLNKALQPLRGMPQDPACLPHFFFLFCMLLLHARSSLPPLSESGPESKIMPTTEQATESSCMPQQTEPSKRKISSSRSSSITGPSLVGALKCALSLGPATLFGLLISKENGFWSSLTVAITITPWKDATFKMANARAQGTAIGSVYGILGAFISQNLMEFRFLVLLPWIIFTSFLQRSRMFGPAGATAAAISAILILGRRNYGSPSSFAIARLTESFVGISCMVSVELLLQSVRASTLAREKLSQSFAVLNECMELNEKEAEDLRRLVNVLPKYIGEAEAEPNLWFLPFPAASYRKLHSSMSKIAELLHMLAKSEAMLGEESNERAEVVARDYVGQMRRQIGCSTKHFAEVMQVKSLVGLEKEWKRKHAAAASKDDDDVEAGKKLQGLHVYGTLSVEEEERRKLVGAFLLCCGELIETQLDHMNVDVKRLVVCLGAIGFCIEGLMKETKEVEMGILELLQRENPVAHINLHDICCKLKDLST